MLSEYRKKRRKYGKPCISTKEACILAKEPLYIRKRALS